MKKTDLTDVIEIDDYISINLKEAKNCEFLKREKTVSEYKTNFSETNIANNDNELTPEIAWARLKEFQDFYNRLKKTAENPG